MQQNHGPQNAHQLSNWQRLLSLVSVLIATFFIAACAQSTLVSGQNDIKKQVKTNEFTGRISLLIQNEPPQSFAGGFTLLGNAQVGEMTLTTPLGNIVAVLRWQPGLAELDNGSQKRQYPSVEAMLEATTGAAIPMSALFAWLQGDQATAPGWLADTTRSAEGRINALRHTPLPQAQLRIVLDQ